MGKEFSDVVFIGNKPSMSYVLAIISAINSGTSEKITLKARGRAVVTAVDVAEIVSKRFLKNLKLSDIKIGTVEMPPREGETRSRMVSTIEISLSKMPEAALPPAPKLSVESPAKMAVESPFSQFSPEELRVLAAGLRSNVEKLKTGAGAPRPARPLDLTKAIQVLPPAKERLINTGFSSMDSPEKALDKMLPLAPSTKYYFWFQIGELLQGNIEVKPEPLKVELLRSGVRLTVVLFAFEGEIKLEPNCDTGEIQVENDGSFKVARRVLSPREISVDKSLLEKRLFFPVQTQREGESRLRCNIYYNQVLVESRLITVHVSAAQQSSGTPALKSEPEYSISKGINANNFGDTKPQILSIMLNDNGDGTHSFRMFGREEFKDSISFSTQSLSSHIDRARRELRRASWDDENPCSNQSYRYEGSYDENRLREDLVLLAKCGYIFWFELASRMTSKIVVGKNVNPTLKLCEITLQHGIVEFATKSPNEASSYAFPVSLIYDYPLNTAKKLEEYTLCPTFLESMTKSEPLEETSCFKGDCPSRGNETVVCPSGFWGFRHSIGMPMKIGAQELKPRMLYDKAPVVDCAAFQAFYSWAEHKKNLESLSPQINWQMKFTHDETVKMLKTTSPHLVYFYCEGGAENEVPYIQVGDENEAKITPDNFSPLCWFDPMPLVFINGCRTAALDPNLMMSFVSDFIYSFHASGVVGTEIQVFEQLASVFAEDCLRRFLVDGKSIGDAIRETRLSLLKKGNPLGLVYSAYANASLRLKSA